MNTFKKPGDLTTVQEAIQYIDHYLNQRAMLGDENTAAAIVGLGVNDHYNEWVSQEPALDEISGIASDLEWSNGNAQMLQSSWERIASLLSQLESKYRS